MVSALNYSSSSVRVNYANSKDENSAQKNGQTTNKQDTKTQEVITKLQARDTEVRAHEAAHMAAGGGIAGGASYDYQIGPDGKAYAIGGEVPIDMSPEGNPKDTQAKMQKVKAAALAPTNPSPQDIKVASTASMIEMKAKMQELKENSEDVKNGVKKAGLKQYEKAQGVD
jgi:hypothetical protein